MMDQSALEMLNHPMAVVVIIAVVFGFGMMGLDKLFYFLKSVTKKTPMDKMAASYDLMTKTVEQANRHMEQANEHMKENTQALHTLNSQMQRHEEMAAMRHQQLLRELDRKCE